MRRFKRYLGLVFVVIVYVYLFQLVIACIVQKNLWSMTVTPSTVKFGIIEGIIFVSWLISFSILPPDFNYLIKVDDTYIIFEMDEEDHRRINKNFTISIKTRRYMVLTDGVSRIKIAYNKEVLEFLEEIKNQ